MCSPACSPSRLTFSGHSGGVMAERSHNLRRTRSPVRSTYSERSDGTDAERRARKSNHSQQHSLSRAHSPACLTFSERSNEAARMDRSRITRHALSPACSTFSKHSGGAVAGVYCRSRYACSLTYSVRLTFSEFGKGRVGCVIEASRVATGNEVMFWVTDIQSL